MRLRLPSILFLLAGASTLAAASALAAPSPFDGNWSVILACADTQDRNGLVKGYDYRFDVTIQDGALRGQYGVPGHPASVVYTGQVTPDGALEIRASGNTGRSDYAVGKVAEGTRYNYTLQGTLEATRGSATRREVRPCTATFSKL